MDYYCEIGLKIIKAKNKYKHFKSKSHIEFDKCKHEIISYKDVDINDVDEAIYLYLVELNKKFDYYLIKCEFKLGFNDYQFCPYVMSNLSDNKTKIAWKNFLMKVIDDFKDKGYNFSHIAEMHIITIAKKIDLSYDFYLKHNMHAIEGKSNAMVDKSKIFIKKFPRNWRHPLNRKLENYRD